MQRIENPSHYLSLEKRVMEVEEQIKHLMQSFTKSSNYLVAIKLWTNEAIMTLYGDLLQWQEL